MIEEALKLERKMEIPKNVDNVMAAFKEAREISRKACEKSREAWKVWEEAVKEAEKEREVVGKMWEEVQEARRSLEEVKKREEKQNET